MKIANFTQLTDQPGPELFPSLSPDGKSLAYAAQTTPGNWDIYLQRVGGKNPINLTKDSPKEDTQPAFSPDGEQIAFRSEREGGGIFVMGATGESVRRLTDSCYNPAWSPDGKEIACATEGVTRPENRSSTSSQLWRVNVTTGQMRQITKGGDAVQPHWSPHGDHIAYWAVVGGQRDIWTIPTGGGDPVRVTNDVHMNWNPIWSPDGNHLYCASDRGGSMNLWRVPVEEKTGKVLGAPEPLTTPSPYSGYLSISRDGRRIAYVQKVDTSNIYKVQFNAGKGKAASQPVAVTQGSRPDVAPDVSPDGEWLAFWTAGKQDDIFIVRKDGTGIRQLTNDVHRDRFPRWSPDGRRIAFYSNRSGRYQIWAINPDASSLQQLTETPGDLWYSVWSPDGLRLACTDYENNIFLMEAGKTRQSPKPLPKWEETGAFAPWSWALDGSRLAGFRTRGGGIFVFSLELQKYQKLTDSGTYPVWLKDGRRLLFTDREKLYVVDSRSGKIQEVLSVAPRFLGAFPTFSLSRDERLIYFSLGTSEGDVWMLTIE